MKKILLNTGDSCLVDDTDYEWLRHFSWNLLPHRNNKYAYRTTKTKTFSLMHREILDFPKGMQTDHIDGNGLNNQRHNLRVVTNRINCQNKHMKKSSKYSGVCFVPRNSKKNPWMVGIRINKKVRHLGYYNSEEVAGRVYNSFAKVVIVSEKYPPKGCCCD